MTTINIDLSKKKVCYPVIIDDEVVSSLEFFISKNYPAHRVVVITDTTIAKLQSSLLDRCSQFTAQVITIPCGEQEKSRERKQQLENELLKNKYGKDTLLIALGGGVIGDLVGYLASTYLRGIPYIHMPTTLLAMIDSAIGGKTGVNTPYGKNLIGSTWQPVAVFENLNFLNSLPSDEFSSGMAEIIKIAFAQSEEFVIFLEREHENITQKDPEVLQHVIAEAVKLKKNIVEQDELETGKRQILNLGHTIGHAIEQHQQYQTKHGFCVAQGTVVEGYISHHLGHLTTQEIERIKKLLTVYGLPVTIKKEFTLNELQPFLIQDKKTRNEEPHFVLLKTLGQVLTHGSSFSCRVEPNIIQKALEDSFP